MNQEYICRRCNNKFKWASGYLVRQIPVEQIPLPKVYEIAAPEGQTLLEQKIERLKNWISNVAEKKTDFVYSSAGKQYFKTDILSINTKKLTELERLHHGYIDQGGHVWSTKPSESELVEIWGRYFARKWYGHRFQKLRNPLQLKFRKKIFGRDGNKCRVCKSTEKLELAHIIPIHVVIDCGLPMKAAFVNENLVTLCKKCHNNIHHGGFRDIRYTLGMRKESAKKAIIRFAEKKLGIFPKALTFPDPLPWW